MAQLASGDPGFTESPIPASTQLLAVAWLRWRMFANSFRRQKSSVGLVLAILLRALIWPIFALMALGPIVGCGFAGWMVIADNHPRQLAGLLAAIFLLWQFISINGVSIAATVSSFDPSSLLRFPLSFGRYLVLRTLLGLLTASTIVGCLALLAAAIGIGIADHGLALPALVVLGVYALMNIFFARMLAAWMERWLATRRAREFFGALMAFLFIGVQFLNLRRVAPNLHAANRSFLLQLMHGSNQFLRWLPPGFAASSILLRGHVLAALAQFVALLACTALFLAVFAMRLHKQFLGELLSESAAQNAPAPAPATPRSVRPAVVTAAPAPAQPERTVVSPVVAACLRKEWVYLRGNTNLVISMFTPLLFVFILSRGMFASHPAYFLPGALGYVLFGLLAALYNIFGADASGFQLYLLAPIRVRDVILAKNMMSLTMLLTETILAWIVVLLLAKSPIPLATHVSAFFWIILVIVANLTLGTLRSIQAPRKFVPGQARQLRSAPTNRTSGLLVLAVLFGSLLLQIPVMLLCRHFHQPWLAALIFAPLAVAAVFAYALLLRNAEALVLSHRDLITQELCGT